MKTFKDLIFRELPENHFGTPKISDISFGNGYRVTVIKGVGYQSNGIDTYELNIYKNGEMVGFSVYRDMYLDYIDENSVSEVMKTIQLITA